ncbi:hypothetical protein ACFQ0M_02125 [Kitasatospora aburaviensis]
MVTGYRQARTVLADPRFSNVPAPKAGRRTSEGTTAGARSVLEQHMLNTDGAEHRRLRRLASVAFTPRRVDALTDRIAGLTDSVLAELTARAERGGVVDLVDDFAFPLPVLVISEILGVPEQDRLDLRTWTYRVGSPPAPSRRASSTRPGRASTGTSRSSSRRSAAGRARTCSACWRTTMTRRPWTTGSCWRWPSCCSSPATRRR